MSNEMLKDKKAFSQLQVLVSVAVIFVVAIIVFAFGAQIVGDVQDDLTASSSEYNVTVDGLAGMTNVSSKFPTLGTIVIAVVIIGLLVSGFYVYGKMR